MNAIDDHLLISRVTQHLEFILRQTSAQRGGHVMEDERGFKLVWPCSTLK